MNVFLFLLVSLALSSCPSALNQGSCLDKNTVEMLYVEVENDKSAFVQVPWLEQETQNKRKIRIVVISDTHNKHKLLNIPDGDILLHCGDFSYMYDWKQSGAIPQSVTDFNIFLGTLPHKYKVIIAGNHELGLPRQSANKIQEILSNGIFLQDTSLVLEGIHIYGTAWNNIPHMAWGANEHTREEKWKLIPKDTDVLVTHQPPYGIRDLGYSRLESHFCPLCNAEHKHSVHWGDENLLQVIKTIKPKVHCFGHVHEGAGWETHDGVTFINAATDKLQRPFYFDFYVSHNTN